jgi:hypothetical protein
MARETINIGVVANDGTGDSFRIAGQKINNNFAELYTTFEPTELGDGIELTGNDIVATRSNDNINFVPAGTGIVTMQNLIVDGNIRLTDNSIATEHSNSDLELSAAGTGIVKIDSINIHNNTISTNTSNADLQLITAGTGKISINALRLPRSDNGLSGQAIRTDAAGTLSFVNVDYLLDHTVLDDGTATLSSSATTDIDTFDSTVYRSVKYVMSISDATNSRFEILEAVITHDGSTAYVSDYGSTTNYTGSLLTLTADFSGSDVRLRATPISSDSTVIKFLARRQVI